MVSARSPDSFARVAAVVVAAAAGHNNGTDHRRGRSAAVTLLMIPPVSRRIRCRPPSSATHFGPVFTGCARASIRPPSGRGSVGADAWRPTSPARLRSGDDGRITAQRQQAPDSSASGCSRQHRRRRRRAVAHTLGRVPTAHGACACQRLQAHRKGWPHGGADRRRPCARARERAGLRRARSCRSCTARARRRARRAGASGGVPERRARRTSVADRATAATLSISGRRGRGL